MSNHLISKDKTLLEALSQINEMRQGPLVLFVIDGDGKMVGTLTDGDSRRALIGGCSVNDKVERIMHKDFNYLSSDDLNDVNKIKRQKDLQMKLVPVLDKYMHIIEVIDLQK